MLAVLYKFVDETIVEEDEEVIEEAQTKAGTSNKGKGKDIKQRQFTGKKAEQEKRRAFKELVNTIFKKINRIGAKTGCDK